MLLRDISFPSPRDNILYDEVLLSMAEDGTMPEVLRFWESPVTFVVLGRIGRPEEDVFMEAVTEDNVPILRRASGGGTVLQGAGCLNYSLILSKAENPAVNDLHRSYRFILGRIVEALGVLGFRAAFRPLSDLVLLDRERKFSGNAQHRGRNFILHHGTVLYDFDLTLTEKYLRIPNKMPDYRRSRTHSDFLVNLRPAPARSIKQAIGNAFGASRCEDDLTDEEIAALENLRQKRRDTLVYDAARS